MAGKKSGGLFWKLAVVVVLIVIAVVAVKGKTVLDEVRHNQQFGAINQELQVSIENFMKDAAALYGQNLTEQQIATAYAPLVKQRMDAVDVALAKLRAMKVPKTRTQVHSTYISMLEKTNELNRPVYEAALRGDYETVSALGDNIEMQLAPMLEDYVVAMQKSGIAVPETFAQDTATEIINRRDNMIEQSAGNR